MNIRKELLMCVGSIFLLGFSPAAFPCGGNDRARDEANVAEVVYRYQLENCYRHWKPKVFFLVWLRHDPSDELMRRFKDNNPPVKKYSQMETSKESGEFKDKETGERGALMSIDRIRWLSESEVEVEGACGSGATMGEGAKYLMARERGHWVIKESKRMWVARSNNGMHSTRDPTALKFLQWLGRAGDAWRYALPVSGA